jgi:hypothetical protein
MKFEILQHLPARWRRWLLGCAATFVVYSLVGFFLLPLLIKWQMVKRLPALTKRQAAVQQVKLNPWTLSLTMRGLALTEPDGRSFASWDELYVNFQASSLFRWAWTFKEIRLVKPFGEVILLKDGRLNFANMLEAPTHAPPQPQTTSVPRLNIFHLEVTNGFVALEDRTLRSLFHTEYRPININVTEFTTRPNSDTPYAFRAESDAGRSITWAGDLTIQPLRSSGHLEVTAVKFSRYQPYLEAFTSARVTNGLADLQFNYRFSASTNGLDFIVTNGAMQVSQVQVLDPDTSETVASLRGLEVQQAEFNLRERAVRLGAVKVSEAALLARLKENGCLNLLDLIRLPPPATNSTPSAAAAGGSLPPWTATVDNFTIEQTALSFEDLTRRRPFKTELKPIELALKHFSTKADSDASYSFHITSEAAEAVEGAGTASINPIRSSGEVKIGAVDVKKYLAYAEDFFRGRILSGKIEARVPYRFALGTNGLLAGVTNLAVKLTDLEVKLPENDETVTRIAEIGFERVEASLEDRRGRIGLFKGNGGSVVVRRQKDGAINLLGLLAVSRTNVAPASGSGSIQAKSAAGAITNVPAYALGGWTLNLDELQLDNYTMKIEDLMPPKPASFLLDQLALNLKGISTASNAPVSARVSLRLNETGAIAAAGTAKIAPLFADFNVAVTNLDLRAAQPYVEQFVRLSIMSGALNTAGQLHFQTNDTAAPQMTFAGGLSLTNFVTTDQVVFKEFVRWDDLTVTGIEAALAPNRFKIAEIRLGRPHASLLIGADRRPNLSLILKPDDAVTNHPTASAPTSGAVTNSFAELFPMQLGKLTLDQASLTFTDDSVQPHVVMGVQEVSGSIKGLSSALNTPAEVNLHGRVDAQSPFSIAGRVNPFAATMFVDLAITNANTQLTPLTGYLEKYGGYPLNKGRLSTSLRYHVEGKALKAENKIQIDQLTLGSRNTSPDAISLPLKLGIALLKDNNGRIDLDVPVNGRLDDPEFKLGPIVLKIVVNMIVKAAASPFKLLGSLVGGGGDELSFVEFTPGTTNLVEGQLDKLGKLAAALAKRPALNLEIGGAIDRDSDRDALAKQKLHEQLKAKRLQELTAKGQAPISIEIFLLEPEDQDRLLRTAFVEQFGTNISQIIQTNLVRLTATNQPGSLAAAKPTTKPKRSLFQRLAGLFGGGSGHKTKAEKRLSKADRQALDQTTPELMEDLLAEKVMITDEEFRQLSTSRARWVQDWLIQNGQVKDDRLFLIAPKPMDAGYRDERRVNLSLN